jgi:tetratricopeptide (TPR) repeat protein
MTQSELAGERYTKTYISALEHGATRASMAALQYLGERLGLAPAALLGGDTGGWTRLAADVHLAAGDWQLAADGYRALLPATADARIRAELLLGLAEAVCRLDAGSEAVTTAGEALELFRRQGRRPEAAVAMYWLSSGHYLSDSLLEARSLLDQVRAEIAAGVVVEPDLPARSLIALAAVEYREGHGERALALLQQARGLTHDLDDRRRATYLFALAASFRELGDFEAALNLGRQSIGLYRAARADHEAASMSNELALTYLKIGNLSEASRFAAEAHAAFASQHEDRMLAHVIETEAQIALASGDVEGAEARATEAIEHAERLGNQKALISAHLTRARARAAGTNPDLATVDFERALEVAQSAGASGRRREILSAWAAMEAVLGHHESAYRLADQALQQT